MHAMVDSIEYYVISPLVRDADDAERWRMRVILRRGCRRCRDSYGRTDAEMRVASMLCEAVAITTSAPRRITESSGQRDPGFEVLRSLIRTFGLADLACSRAMHGVRWLSATRLAPTGIGAEGPASVGRPAPLR